MHAERQPQEFVMRACTIDYLAPARFDDLVETFIRVSRIGRTSVTYECAAYRMDDDLHMVTAHQTLVYIDLAERQAALVPDDYRAAIGAFEGDDVEL
jgi:acyl-CoA thioester hydrolase